MATRLFKSIALGASAPGDLTQHFAYVYTDYLDTYTPYMRIWVDWRKLAPYGWNDPDTDNTLIPATTGAGEDGTRTVREYVQQIDYQLRVAHQNNIATILTFHYTPSWASGIASTVTNYSLYPPADDSPTGPWAGYLLWCYWRWSSFNTATQSGGNYADILEICNEPNLSSDSAMSQANKTFYFGVIRAGRKMVWAAYKLDQYKAYGIQSPAMAGPAMYTGPHGKKSISSDSQYTQDLMGYLNTNGFIPNANFFWTIHNYGDCANMNTVYAQQVRAMLIQKNWSGWPTGAPGYGWILQTEGGQYYDASHPLDSAQRVHATYTNTHNDTPGVGAGIFMFTNYLDYSPASFPTGLRDAQGNLYPLFGVWRSLPTASPY